MPETDAEKGIDVLFKIDVSETDTPSYVTVLGFRATTISFNGSMIDATSGDSAGRWRELIAAYGTRSMTLSGQGVLRTPAAGDNTNDTFQKVAFGSGQVKGEAVAPGLGTFTGLFQLTSMEYAGNHDGGATYSFTLESAGQITFAAAT